MANKKRRIRLSKISALHYFKLFFRSFLFIAATVLYILHKIRNTSESFGGYENNPVILNIIWIVFVFEMVLRFFPSMLESMGCQKQFKKNFIETDEKNPDRQSRKTTALVVLSWVLLNSAIGVLYFFGIIDRGILLLISLFYSVCDMVCILFFCPFQTWMMKNKCCGSCRIYNWDYAMMFTPLVFIKNAYAWSLLGIALLLLVCWELSIIIHPERFSENTNACLSCSNCKEKLCHHKVQLRYFLKKNKERFKLSANRIINRKDKK